MENNLSIGGKGLTEGIFKVTSGPCDNCYCLLSRVPDSRAESTCVNNFNENRRLTVTAEETLL